MARVLVVPALALAGCSLYFGPDGPDSTTPPPVATVALGCLRAVVPTTGASLFVTSGCQPDGGAIIQMVALTDAGLIASDARADFPDQSNRLVAVHDTITPDVLMLSAHRPEIWAFTVDTAVHVSQRMTLERPFRDVWMGDLNRQGVRDVLLAGDDGPGAIRVAEVEDGTGGLRAELPASAERELLTGWPFQFVAPIDLDGDGKLDLFYEAGGPGLPYELGTARRRAGQPVTFAPDRQWGEAARPGSAGPRAALRVADLDGDGRPDIVGMTERAFVYSSHYLELSFLDGVAARAVAVGDVDGDGARELVVAGDAQISRVRLGLAAGHLALEAEPLVDDRVDALEAADLDGDGRAELIGIRDLAQPDSTLVVHRATAY